MRCAQSRHRAFWLASFFENFPIFKSFLQWNSLDFGRQKSSFSVILEAGRAVWYESLQKKDVGKTGLQSIFFYNDPYFVGRAVCGF